MLLIDPKNLPCRKLVKHDWLNLAGRAYVKGWNSCIDDILTCVRQIDAEPIWHGHWTEDGCCSECGEMGLYNGNEEIVRSRYCPYCGEKMDLK